MPTQYNIGTGGDYADLATLAAAGVLANGDFIQLLSGYSVDQQVSFASLDNITVTGDVENPAGYVVAFTNPSDTAGAHLWTSTNCTGWTYRGFTLSYTNHWSTGSAAWYGSGTTSDNLFWDLVINSTSQHGILAPGDNSVLKRCRFTSTPAGNATYCVYTGADDLILESCFFRNASSYAFYLGGDDCIVRSCTIYNDNSSSENVAFPNGGYLVGANAVLSNTVVDMSDAGATSTKKGILLGDAATATVNNCVLFGATWGDNDDLVGHASATTSSLTLSSGIGANDVMVDPASGDYTPANPGLLYHAGNATQYGTCDVLRNGMFANSTSGTPSIGAYEYQGAAHGSGTTYQIGVGGDYATVQTCVAAGVIAHGDTLQLKPGYSVDEQISITNWRNVTLVGDVTNPADYTVQFTNPPGGAAGAATITGSNHYGVQFKGFTLKFLGLLTTSSGAFTGGWFGKGNTLFEDMVISAGAYYGTSSPGSGSTWRRCRIESPLDTASVYGIHEVYGDCLVVEACALVNWASIGIYVDSEAVIIRNCTVWMHQTGAGIYALSRGVVLGSGSPGADITNCVIATGGTVGEGFTTSYGVSWPNLAPYPRFISTVVFGFTNDVFGLGSPLEQDLKLTADVSSAAVAFRDVATLDLSPSNVAGNVLFEAANIWYSAPLDLKRKEFDTELIDPSIGAYRGPTGLTTINTVANSLTRYQAGFTTYVSGNDVRDPNSWTVTPDNQGAASTVVKVEHTDGTAVAVLDVSIPLSAATPYTFTCTAKDSAQDAMELNAAGVITLNLSKSLSQDGGDFYYGLLRALTNSVAQSCHEQTGRLTTRLIADFDPSDEAMLVETTLGFPTKGFLFVDNRRFSYDGLDTNRFLKVAALSHYEYAMTAPFLNEWTTEGTQLYLSIPAKTEVLHDVAAHLPD